MKFTKSNMAKRVLTIVSLMLLLATVLTGCGGCGSQTVTLSVGTIENTQWDLAKQQENNVEPTLNIPEFQNLAVMLQSAYSAGFKSNEMIVAAYRGYNLLHLDQTPKALVDAGYPDIKTESGKLLLVEIASHVAGAAEAKMTELALDDWRKLSAEDWEAIKVAVKTANPEADVDELIRERDYLLSLDETLSFNSTAVVEGVKAANDKSENKLYNETLNKLTTLSIADLRVLVNAFQQTPEMTVDNGLWATILVGVGKVLNFLTTYLGFGNYLLGICIFAIIVEALMLPFAIKQQKNSIKQAQLRPKEMAIRNKYKNRNDQASMQKMQAEIQEFYQRENFSPYSGCLQLLIQMPIIIALYNIVIDPLRYVLGQASGLATALATYATASPAAGGLGLSMGASGSGSIGILSALSGQNMEGLKSFELFTNGSAVLDAYNGMGSVPNFNVLGVNFGNTPSFTNFSILLLVPVLTFAVYFVSSKVSRKLMNSQPKASNAVEQRQMACSNVMMDIMMPALSTYFTFVVPALIGVYWIFRCLLNMLKQYIMSKAMPLPVFTEEDYKAAAREMAGKRPIVKKSANVGKVRSLHHIDDEDFDDTRERALARKAAIEAAEREKQEQLAENAPVAEAPIKKDNAPKKKKNKVEKVAEQKVDLPRTTAPEEETVAEEPVAEAAETTQETDTENKDGE